MWSVSGIMSLALAFGVSFPVSLHAQEGKRDTAFEKAKEQARADQATDAGSKYSDAVLIPFSLAKGTAERLCYEPHKSTAAAGMQVVFKVAGDGSLQELLIRPDNAFTKCIRSEVANSKLPRPPNHGFWVHFRVTGSY
jgi:hypothetical protein